MSLMEQNFALSIVAVLLFIGAKRLPELMISHAEQKKRIKDELANKRKANLF